jgi:hypothetical protein
VADLAQAPGAAYASLPPDFTPAGYVPDDPRPAYITAMPEDATTNSAQAAAEGVVVDDGDYVEFMGEKFRLADKVGIMPMVQFGFASKKGLDSDDMEGLAAMYSLIRSVIHRPPLMKDDGTRARDESGKMLRDETEWNRFVELAEDELADGEDVMGFVNRAMEIMAARPSKPREVSSGSSRPTLERSKPDSSSPVTPREMDGLVPVSRVGH